MKNRKQKTSHERTILKWQKYEAKNGIAADGVQQRRDEYLYGVRHALMSVAKSYRFYLDNRSVIRHSAREYQQLSEHQMLRRLLDGLPLFRKYDEFFVEFEEVARTADAEDLLAEIQDLTADYG